MKNGIIRGLLDGDTRVKVAEAAISHATETGIVYPEEQVSVSRAVEKRQREFFLGRTLARQALSMLNIQTGPIPSNADRSPQWPVTVSGSISHCDSWCAAAVAHKSAVEYLGIDVEDCVKRILNNDMVESICVTDELRSLQHASQDVFRRTTMMIFSAKESWYKALYPITRSFLGFHSARVEILSERDGIIYWKGVLLEDWPPFHRGDEFPCGRARFSDNYVGTALIAAERQ